MTLNNINIIMEKSNTKQPISQQELDLRMQLAQTEEKVLEMRAALELEEDDVVYERKEEELEAMEQHFSSLNQRL